MEESQIIKKQTLRNGVENFINFVNNIMKSDEQNKVGFSATAEV